ncbi:unnamed protein product [Periconia digitata]|uniref:Uncharacterized protein n=1 Tax=Periconia digitata TaxID=1303443 RepID=A0A9W4UIS0_9PLEO|nr:unnamed protein product [Periconia digitata]
MVSQSIISLLWIAAAVSPTSALPSRTHCRCTIVDSSSPSIMVSQNPEMLSPSTSRTSPSSIRNHKRSPSGADVCRDLGPELENFRFTNPKAYADFIAHSSSTEVWVDPSTPPPSSSQPESSTTESSSPTEEQVPLSTTVLLQLASRKGLTGLGVVDSSKQQFLQSAPRIRCTTEEVEDFKAYQDSVYTLLALQIIVAFTVLACIVEGFVLIARWFRKSPYPDAECENNNDNDPFSRLALPSRSIAASRKPAAALRLSGAEKRLRAFPSSDPIFSPGADKKMRSYRASSHMVAAALSASSWSPSPVGSGCSEKKVFEAWVDEDDEMNRPVM